MAVCGISLTACSNQNDPKVAQALILSACDDIDNINNISGSGSVASIISTNLDSAIKKAGDAVAAASDTDRDGFSEFQAALSKAKSVNIYDDLQRFKENYEPVYSMCEIYAVMLNE